MREKRRDGERERDLSEIRPVWEFLWKQRTKNRKLFYKYPKWHHGIQTKFSSYCTRDKDEWLGQESPHKKGFIYFEFL